MFEFGTDGFDEKRDLGLVLVGLCYFIVDYILFLEEIGRILAIFG